MLTKIGKGTAALVALVHFYIMILEMFLIKSRGEKVFGLEPAQLENDTVIILFFNQGAYNGALAAGLIASLFMKASGWPLRVFILLLIAAVGIVGGASSNPKIYFIQTLPALLALAFEYIGKKKT